MEEKNILDSDMLSSFQKNLLEGEEIEWQGVPKPKFSIVFLEGTSGFDGVIVFGSIKLIGWILGLIMLIGIGFLLNGRTIGFFIALFFAILMFFSPDIVKNKRKKATKYAFTKNRVFFQLWKRGKTSIHVIDLADVVRLDCNSYNDKRGTIHFMLNKKADFYTYDFVSGKRRFYPSFEMIPDALEVRDQIEKFRRERIRNSK
jgi:hypothetical protein